MFGIGFSETVIIALALLIFVGPSRLPDFMRQLGQFFVKARRFSNEVRDQIQEAIQVDDVMRDDRKRFADPQKDKKKEPTHSRPESSQKETQDENSIDSVTHF